MSQISPPIRILLVCAVAFLAAWMLFLRPKDDAGTPAAATPTAPSTRPVEAGGDKSGSLAGKAVEQANEATAAQDARAEELAGGAGETAAAPAATAATPTATAATAATTGAPTRVVMPSKEELAQVPGARAPRDPQAADRRARRLLAEGHRRPAGAQAAEAGRQAPWPRLRARGPGQADLPLRHDHARRRRQPDAVRGDRRLLAQGDHARGLGRHRDDRPGGRRRDPLLGPALHRPVPAPGGAVVLGDVPGHATSSSPRADLSTAARSAATARS